MFDYIIRLFACIHYTLATVVVWCDCYNSSLPGSGMGYACTTTLYICSNRVVHICWEMLALAHVHFSEARASVAAHYNIGSPQISDTQREKREGRKKRLFRSKLQLILYSSWLSLSLSVFLSQFYLTLSGQKWTLLLLLHTHFLEFSLLPAARLTGERERDESERKERKGRNYASYPESRERP